MARAPLALIVTLAAAVACDRTGPVPVPDPNVIVSVSPAAVDFFSGPADSTLLAVTIKDTLGAVRADLEPQVWLAENYADLSLGAEGRVLIGPHATPWAYEFRAAAGGHTTTVVIRVRPRPTGKLVYSANVAGAGQVFVKDFALDGSGTQLTNGTDVISGIALDPELGFIYFGRGPLPSSDIYRMAIDGTGLVNLTNSAASQNQGPSVNLLTHEVFFSRRDATATQIAKMAPDGSGLTILTTGSQNKLQPAVSPDGTRMAYGEFFPSFNREIMMANADGTSPLRITNRVGGDDGAFWQFDQRVIWSGSGITGVVPSAPTIFLTILPASISASQPSRECSPEGILVLSFAAGGTQAFYADLPLGRLVRYAIPGTSSITFARRYCD